MPTGRIKTRRWNDPAEPDEGFRLLICRYRPRGVRKEDETWDDFWPRLGPSPELHAAFYGKDGAGIIWTEYRERYLEEMKREAQAIRSLAWRVRGGETVTLLCSSACVDPRRCHRTLLAALVEEQVRSGAR